MRFTLAAASLIGLAAASPAIVPVIGVSLTYPDGTYSNIFPVPSDGQPYLHASKGPVSDVFIQAYHDGTKYHLTECNFLDAAKNIVKAVAIYKPTISEVSPAVEIAYIECNIGN
ncbi:hypothetical protein PT974_05740 [Cladobotryum mycophilum]|uniref:Uncharacterized protein n=1 Tax=Cladobotryum mycophilum TaxID=491253 RepID=A0ABR0SJK3_9HYPO